MDQKAEIRGARKRKSTAIIRIIQKEEIEPTSTSTEIETEPGTEPQIIITEQSKIKIIDQNHQNSQELPNPTTNNNNNDDKKQKETPQPPQQSFDKIQTQNQTQKENPKSQPKEKTNSNNNNNIKKIPLKEPSEKVTLIQRSLGLSQIIDEKSQRTALNISVFNGPPFSCTICKSWFYFGNKLKIHYIVNHNRFHCELCGALFDTKNEKDEHNLKVHNVLQCEICQDEINRLDIWFHYDEDHDAVSCRYCSNLLFPKSFYREHLNKYHRIIETYGEGEPLGTFVIGDLNFQCKLCLKTREVDGFYGHVTSYHKFSITQLMTIMSNNSYNLTVDGTTVEERITDVGENEEIVPIENPKKIFKSNCLVCRLTFDDKIQSKFHNVYCLQKVQCLYCYSVFENSNFREKHNKKYHYSFNCFFNCKTYFETEELFNQHLTKIHDVVTCRYCDEIIKKDKFKDHLANKHNYKATIMENFTDTLFEITSNLKNKNIVICCLCENDLTELIDSVTSIFDHFYIEHNLSIRKINRLITPKPSLTDYDNFYKEIETSIENDNSVNETVNKNHSEDSHNKENKALNTVNLEKIRLETDIDYENVESLIDFDHEYSDTEFFSCEICSNNVNQNISLLDYVIHLKEKHRLLSKYTEHECKICTEILLTIDDLNRHIVESHSMNQYPVEKYECGCVEKPYIYFAKDHVLENHNIDEEKHHVKAVGYKCRFCDEYFWGKIAQNDHEVGTHLEENRENFIKCPICLSSHGNQCALKLHMEEEHKNYQKYNKISYKCNHCTTVFPNISTLREHFGSNHSTERLYRCPYPNCYKHFKLAKNVKYHLKKPHINIQPENYELAPCEACGIMLKSRRAMTVHGIVRHRRDKLGYMCKICKERFQTVEQRKLHVTTAHPGKAEYCCSDCGRCFNSKSGLNGHRTSVHTPQQQYDCPYCQKEFMRKDTYMEHLLIHTGPKHQCPHCPKLFTQRSNLIRHIRTHTGEKPYNCGFCEKTFSDQGAKRSHERMHTAEEHCQCKECGKTFTKWQKLKYHMKLHTGEGLLPCDICGKPFTNNYGLRVHREIHFKENDEMKVVCECGKAFTKEKYLQRHKENMHNPQKEKFTCPICFKQLNAKTRSARQDHILTHTKNKRFKCLICNKSCYTKRTLRKHICLKHNITGNDTIAYIQENPETEDSINIAELLNEENVLQGDIVELEDLIETNDDEVQVKSEPLSEPEMSEFEDEPLLEPEPESDDDRDKDFVVKGVKKSKTALRSSPRTRNNPKLYKYDFSDEDD